MNTYKYISLLNSNDTFFLDESEGYFGMQTSLQSQNKSTSKKNYKVSMYSLKDHLERLYLFRSTIKEKKKLHGSLKNNLIGEKLLWFQENLQPVQSFTPHLVEELILK